MIDGRVLWVVLFSVMSAAVVADAPQISNPWVRAMPPGQRMTAVYLRVQNPGVSDVAILGVSSALGRASLHETRLENGRSSMQAVDSLSLGAGEAVVMEPGGLHIMLMGLETTPAEGDVVPICLQTTEGDVCADAQVRRAAPAPHNGHDH